jgi:hypothetical protein
MLCVSISSDSGSDKDVVYSFRDFTTDFMGLFVGENVVSWDAGIIGGVGLEGSREDGSEEGCKEGWEVGCKDGWEVGCKDGCEEGCKEGWEVGCKEGWEVGCAVGVAVG